MVLRIRQPPVTEDDIKQNFGILEPADVITSDVYDEYSVMNYDTPISVQYDPNDPSDGTQPDGTPWPEPREIVQIGHLSDGDKAFIAQMYPH